jgi:hypothetical protein
MGDAGAMRLRRAHDAGDGTMASFTSVADAVRCGDPVTEQGDLFGTRSSCRPACARVVMPEATSTKA